MKKSIFTLFVTLSLLLTVLFVPAQATTAEQTAHQPTYTQELPVLAGDEGIGKDVVYTQTVSAHPLQPTEQQAYNIMIALKAKFPEGATFTNRHFYAWKGGVFSGGHGCAGFCFYLSDACFGSAPAIRKNSYTYEEIKVGDCLRINNDQHIVTIMEKYADYVVISEANVGDRVYWNHTMTRDQVMQGDYLLTRYGKWIPSGSDWYYQLANGSYAKGWLQEKGTWYYMNTSSLT